MNIPSDLGGHTLVGALCRTWDYVKVNQVGSHIVLQTQTPTPHRVSIPTHKTLRIGTLNSILRSVANHKGVDRQTILDSIP